MNFRNFYRAKDVAKLLGIRTRSVINEIEKGKVLAVKLETGRYLIPDSELFRIMRGVLGEKAKSFPKGYNAFRRRNRSSKRS